MAGTEEDIYVIFGAGGGVGSELCKILGQWPHAKLALVDNGQEKLNHVKQMTKGQPCSPCCDAVLDASDPKAVDDFFDKLAKQSNMKIRGVVNCIGNVVRKPLLETTPEDFMEIVKENLLSSFNVMRAGVKHLSKDGKGAIVMVSSAAAEHGIKHHEAWSAAKAGVEGLVRSTAASYAPKGLRINCVAPGTTRTAESKEATGAHGQEVAKKTAALYPMCHVAEPFDVASAIEFLLCPKRAAFITGQVLAVDGGFTTLHAHTEEAAAH